MTTETEMPVRVCDHGIHQAADWVVLSEGEIVARAVTRDDAKLEALPGDSIRLQFDPNPCGEDAEFPYFMVSVPEFVWLCAKHIRLHHEEFENEESVWQGVASGVCAVCG